MTGTDEFSAELSAEYGRSVDLCTALIRCDREQDVLRQIPQVFSDIFLPQRTLFWVLENGRVVQLLIHPPESSAPIWAAENPPIKDFRSDPSSRLPDVTPSGFRVTIASLSEVFGIVEVVELEFPDQADRRLPLALAVADVCGAVLAAAQSPREGRPERSPRPAGPKEALARLIREARQHSADRTAGQTGNMTG